MPDANGNPLPGEVGYVEPVETALDPGASTEAPEATEVTEPTDVQTALEVPTGVQEASDTPVPEYVSPTSEIEAIPSKVASDYITPETTVAGQLETLLNKDSALSQQSRRQTREGASALGMMSSSTAIGEARARNVSALLPVAAKDAESAAKFALQEQQRDNQIQTIQTEAEVSGALLVQKSKATERQEAINRQWDKTFKEMDLASQKELTQYKAEWDMRAKELEGEISKEIQKYDTDAQMKSSIISKATDSINNYHISIQELMASDGFLDNFGGNKAAMYGYFNDMFKSVESSIRLSAKSAGLYAGDGTAENPGMKGYIDDLVASNIWTV